MDEERGVRGSGVRLAGSLDGGGGGRVENAPWDHFLGTWMGRILFFALFSFKWSTICVAGTNWELQMGQVRIAALVSTKEGTATRRQSLSDGFASERSSRGKRRQSVSSRQLVGGARASRQWIRRGERTEVPVKSTHLVQISFFCLASSMTVFIHSWAFARSEELRTRWKTVSTRSLSAGGHSFAGAMPLGAIACRGADSRTFPCVGLLVRFFRFSLVDCC